MYFPKLKHFRSKENWGSANLMNHDLLKILDNFREYWSKPIVVLCGTQGVHSSGSLHSYGLAVDVCCPMELKIMNFYLAAERFGFTGIGIYPNWKFNRKKCGGLHLDLRPIGINEAGSRWLGVLDPDDGINHYFLLDADNIKRFGVL